MPPVIFNRSPFAPRAEVNRMLSAWALQASACQPARGGVENRCLIVDTQTAAPRPSRVVLRLHRPGADERVRLELAALQHLADLDLPVPRPVRTTDGATVADHQAAPSSLLPYVDGRALDRCLPA